MWAKKNECGQENLSVLSVSVSVECGLWIVDYDSAVSGNPRFPPNRVGIPERKKKKKRKKEGRRRKFKCCLHKSNVTTVDYFTYLL